MTCGIYCIENLVNGKKYIGRSVNIEKRFYRHKNEFERKVHGNQHLQRAWGQYGKDSFRFTIVEECPKDELNKREIHYIKFNKTKNSDFGYNLSEGGEGNVGWSPSEETRKKLSESHIGLFSKENNPNYGRHPSEETRRKQSESHIGRFVGKESPNYGKHPSEETRRRLSESHIGVQAGENNSNWNTKKKNATSKYFGVSKIENKDSTSWRVQININGKHICMGTYKTEIEAAKVYDEYVIKNNIPHKLNFPEGENG